MANNDINDKWLIVYQGTKDNFESDANKANYNNKLVIVTGGTDTNAEPYLYVNNGTAHIAIPIPKMYLKGVKIGVDGMEHSFVDDILTFAGLNGISITFKGNAVTIGIDNDTFTKINTAIQKIEPLDNDYITIYDKVGTDGTTKVVEAKTASIAGSKNGLATAQDVRASMPTKLPNPQPLQYSVNGDTSTYTGLTAAAIPAIYAPDKVGSRGQLLQSMGGGVPQWTNLSEIKEAIGFAKDLTGVLEATPEEFTYRPSAGNKSIRDEGAVIRRIKGNTTIWGQCCKNPYLELDKIYNKNQSNASYTNTNEALRITYNSVGNPQGYYLFSTQLENLVKGHIYMVSIDARVSSGLNVEMELYPNYDTVLVFHPNEEWNRYAALYTLTRNTFNKYYYVGINKSSTTTVNAGDYFEFRNAQFIDLTSIFGAGNEPATYEEFKAIYPEIYPYCEPTIRNVKTTAIETVGFNLFNGKYADLIGGKTYYVGGADVTGLTFTPQGSSTSFNIVLSTNRTFTPTQSGRLYSTKVNTCVHFQHSGIKDGECADYVKHTLELPEIAKYFPDGMNGIGDVYDEINSENAIQRIGVVNLGTLTWVKYSDSSTNTVYVARDLQGATGKRTGKTAKYSNTTTAIADMPDKTMLTRTDYPTYIYIYVIMITLLLKILSLQCKVFTSTTNLQSLR
jgi:hypothetical protein